MLQYRSGSILRNCGLVADQILVDPHTADTEMAPCSGPYISEWFSQPI